MKSIEQLKAELNRCEKSQGTGHDIAKINRLTAEIEKRENNVTAAQYEELVDAVRYASDSLASVANEAERKSERAGLVKHLAALVAAHCNRAGQRLNDRAAGAVRRANALLLEPR